MIRYMNSEGENIFYYNGAMYRGKGTRDDPYIWQEQGMTFIDNRTRWMDVKNDYLIVADVIRALFVGFPYGTLPQSVKKLVDEEMFRRHGTKGQKEEVVKRYYERLKTERSI